MLDCLVIGGGPAGLLAAIYLGRYCRNVQVIDAGESRAARIPESHNFPGLFGIGGEELLRRLTAQAKQYGAQLISGRVTSLRREGPAFIASCSSGNVGASFVLLMTGLLDCSLIEGEPANGPSGAIRFCPICDGYRPATTDVLATRQINREGTPRCLSDLSGSRVIPKPSDGTGLPVPRACPAKASLVIHSVACGASKRCCAHADLRGWQSEESGQEG